MKFEEIEVFNMKFRILSILQMKFSSFFNK